MPRLDVVVDCPVHDSFRVQQVAGMFDIPLAERAASRFTVEVPELGDAWQIGLVVGPSGSGKSTIVRQWFGEAVAEPQAWAADRAIVDGFGAASMRSVTGLLTAVGFGSPPGWIKPYWALSNGERFRCDLARAIAEATGIDATGPNAKGPDAIGAARPRTVVFDEFTSVVDRTAARTAAAALSKAIRGGQVHCRFVAVTCHYDVAEWLAPDWTLDMATRQFSRGCLRRPAIELELFRCERAAWGAFAPHHYLSGALSPAARCFLAAWGDAPVAFCATVSLVGLRRRWRISRLVTLPDFQGLGIGAAVAEAVAAWHRQRGERCNITTSHPAMIAHCRRSPLWRAVGWKRCAAAPRRTYRDYRGAVGRAVASFEYRAARNARGEGD
ncbi:MAG: GNAT family N-acetyltransferase [Pirellulales bacterium]|nr:GNAT family N-acetyltransferase [Pirellulales bacterium]